MARYADQEGDQATWYTAHARRAKPLAPAAPRAAAGSELLTPAVAAGPAIRLWGLFVARGPAAGGAAGGAAALVHDPAIRWRMKR